MLLEEGTNKGKWGELKKVNKEATFISCFVSLETVVFAATIVKCGEMKN